MLRTAIFSIPLATLLITQSVQARSQQMPVARASLVHSDGTPAGNVILARKGDHLRLEIEVTGLPSGQHGLHFHAIGRCEGPAFTSAGGHLNPEGHQHGMLNPMGSHLGDLPNFTADSQGNSTTQIDLDQPPAKLTPQIFDADGTAIVIHAITDDYKTDPSGNSGGRIACGVLRKG